MHTGYFYAKSDNVLSEDQKNAKKIKDNSAYRTLSTLSNIKAIIQIWNINKK